MEITAYYTRRAGKMPHITGYCALKVCKRLVALARPLETALPVQRAVVNGQSIIFVQKQGLYPARNQQLYFYHRMTNSNA